MYNKIKKYINNDRIINEDNDYLLKEEYELLIKKKESYNDIRKMLKVYDTYAASHFKTFVKGDAYAVLTAIIVTKPDEYSINNNRISFKVDIISDDVNGKVSYKHGEDLAHREDGFKAAFIKDYHDIMCRLAKKESISVRSYNYDDCTTFNFRQNFIDKVKKIQETLSDINELIEYYKDKIIVVEQDKRLLEELKELNDFFENL